MITMTAEVHRYDKKLFADELFRRSNRFRQQAGKVFVLAMLESIPVWSGAAQATLLPLARALRIKQFVHIRPTVNRSGKTRGIAAGEAKGYAELTPQRGAVNKGASGGVYTMTFSHNLFHFWLLENYKVRTAKSPTPWGSIEKAADEMLDWIGQNSHQFDLSPFIIHQGRKIVKQKTIEVIKP